MGNWVTIATEEMEFSRYSDYAMQLRIHGSYSRIYAALISEGSRREEAWAPSDEIHKEVRYRAAAKGTYEDIYGKTTRIDVSTPYIYISSAGETKEVELTPGKGRFKGDGVIYLQKYVPTPPSAPSDITVSALVVKDGEGIKISWGSGSYATSYRLERSVNGSSYTQIYSGSSREYTDTAQEDWETVQYRVRSYNSDGYSSYRTSDVVKVIHFPQLQFKINNEIKIAEKGWVKVDSQLREIDKMWVKIDGKLKEME